MTLDRENDLCAEVRERPKQGNLFNHNEQQKTPLSPVP